MWNPSESLAWQKGFRLGSGLIWRLLGQLLLVVILQSLVSAHGTLTLMLLVSSLLLLVCVSGVLVVVLVVILSFCALSLLLLCYLAWFRLTGGLPLILLLGLFLIMTAGLVESLSWFGFLLYALLLGCLLLIRAGV